MFKFFFKPQYSIYEYICITLVVSLMLSNMWIAAILLLFPVTLIQVLATRKLEQQSKLEQEEMIIWEFMFLQF